MLEDQVCIDYSQKHLCKIGVEAYCNVITKDMLERHRGWSGIVSHSCLLKFDSRKTRTRSEIYPKITMTTLEQHQLILF